MTDQVTHRIVPGVIMDLTFKREVFNSEDHYIEQFILNFEPYYHMSIIQESAWTDREIFEIALLDPKAGHFQSHPILGSDGETTTRCRGNRLDFYILEIIKELDFKGRPEHMHHNAYI